MSESLKLRWELLNEIRLLKKENKELKKRKKGITIEWLGTEFDKRFFLLIRQYGEWKENLGDSIDQGDYLVKEIHIRKMINEIEWAAKKQAEKYALEGGEIKKSSLKTIYYKIGKDQLVPVNLKSESVTLEWLDEYCGCNYVVRARELIAAAKKQAGK